MSRKFFLQTIIAAILLLQAIKGVFRRDAYKLFDKFTYPELVFTLLTSHKV